MTLYKRDSTADIFLETSIFVPTSYFIKELQTTDSKEFFFA